MKKVFLLFILLIGFHQPLLAEELESDHCEQISSNTLICTNQQGYAYEKKIEGQNMDIETIEREKEKRNKQKKYKKNKEILSNILQNDTQKNLYLQHFPKQTDLIFYKGERVNFNIDVSDINPEYVIFYYDLDDKEPFLTDCNIQDCSNKIRLNVTYNSSSENALNILVKTKNGFYDTVKWNVTVKENLASEDKSYIKERYPAEGQVDAEINSGKEFKIKAHDDNGNLWKIELYKDDELVKDTGDSCNNKTDCSLSKYMKFDRFDIGEIKAKILVRINEDTYRTKIIKWKPNIVRDYYQDITLPKEKAKKALEEKKRLKKQGLQEAESYKKEAEKYKQKKKKIIGSIVVIGGIMFFLKILFDKFSPYISNHLREKARKCEEELRRQKLEEEREEREKLKEEAREKKRKEMEAKLKEKEELDKQLALIEEEEKIKAEIELEKELKITKELEKQSELIRKNAEQKRQDRAEQEEHGINFAKKMKGVFDEKDEKILKKKTTKKATKKTTKKNPKSEKTTQPKKTTKNVALKDDKKNKIAKKPSAKKKSKKKSEKNNEKEDKNNDKK